MRTLMFFTQIFVFSLTMYSTVTVIRDRHYNNKTKGFMTRYFSNIFCLAF